MHRETGNASETVVDVGIPTRRRRDGRPRWLLEAVESVLAQTLDRFRLVVRENAAGEGTLREALEPYLGDPRVRYVASGREQTAIENNNALLVAGDAPYVTILHDDDVWAPEFLERRVAFLEEHPACGFVFGGHKLIDDDGVELARSTPALTAGPHAPVEYVPLLMRHLGKPMPPTALVRRAAYEAVGAAFDPRFPAWDYEMWMRLGARFGAGYVDGWDSSFRVHSQQATYAERWGENWVVFEDHIRGLLERDLPELEIPEEEWRRRRARAFVSAALDAAEAGTARRSLALLREGARTDVGAVARNPRTGAALATVVLGSAGRRALSRARQVVRRRNYLGGGIRTPGPPTAAP